MAYVTICTQSCEIVHAMHYVLVKLSSDRWIFIAPSASQRDEPDRFKLCPRQFKGAGPALPQMGGGCLVYDLHVVPKVATERRWELVVPVRVSVCVYRSDVW